MREQKGISLVALIVTIIVMAILAGIIITAAVADGGIIDRAKDAMIEQERAEIEEIVIGSYVYKVTGSTTTYAYLDLDKTADAIYENLGLNGFRVPNAEKKDDDSGYTMKHNDKQIDIEVEGKHSTYEGTVEKEGLTESGIQEKVEKNELSDLDKLKEYFVNLSLSIVDMVMIDGGLPNFSENMLLNVELDSSGKPTTLEFKGNSVLTDEEANSIEFDKESFVSNIYDGPSEFVITYNEIKYSVEFNREINETDKTVKITAINVDVFKELTIKEELEKKVLGKSLFTEVEGIELTTKEFKDNYIIVEYKNEIFKLTLDTTVYTITKVDESNWKPFGDENDYFLVEKSGNGVKITGLTENGIQDIRINHKLNIPAKIEASDGITEVVEYEVNIIDNNAFSKVLEDVYTLTFDKDVQLKEIGGSFHNMINLTGTLKIPASVEIGGSFNNTKITKLEFSENCKLKKLGSFSQVTTLTGALVIPKTVEEIVGGAFWNTSITSLTFEEGSQLNKIGEMAFHGCKSLTNVINIPSSCEKLEEYAFSRSGITGIKFNGPISIGEDAFSNCTSLAGELYLYDETYLGKNSFYLSIDNITKISISPNVYKSHNLPVFYHEENSKWFVEYRGTYEEFKKQRSDLNTELVREGVFDLNVEKYKVVVSNGDAYSAEDFY